ncbi:RING finger protein 145-like isoform X2 [Mauremys mutica]|uniref:RING finger protein 145-like isoform X2 n=1 Tax=Mauremys mutica TaxID=74926 RepID=UPI001D167652|nr:RING finger protein 145-like isoform X2 [Mauremys mutica]
MGQAAPLAAGISVPGSSRAAFYSRAGLLRKGRGSGIAHASSEPGVAMKARRAQPARRWCGRTAVGSRGRRPTLYSPDGCCPGQHGKCCHVLCVVVLLLPVRSLVRLYLYGLTLLLLFVGHQTARDYMRHEMEDEFQGAVYQDPVVLRRFVTALTDLCERALRPPDEDQAGVAVLCPAAPAAGPALRPPPPGASRGQHLRRLRHCGGGAVRGRLPPAGSLPPGRCGVQGGGSGTGDVQAGGAGHVPLEPAGRPGALPCLLAGALHPPDLLFPGLFQQPPRPAGAALHLPQQRGGVLRHALLPPRLDLHRLLPRPGRAQPLQVLPAGLRRLPERQRHAQTGLLDLQILQRTFLLSIILFIVVTSTLQSMIEIADPIVLALGASQNRSPWKHFRSLSLCLFLLVFPCFMAYKIARFFHMDFWLLILVSSCMLTSLQVMGTLFVYALFMIELLQDAPLEKTDEIIYYVNAVSRVLEFLVAVCVVAYGTWESIFGEWSWMGASVIIIHSYFNVWLRAQSGWKSFLLRREAAKKINSLPRATRGQLRDHNDVCAICFQEMNVAVITDCGHFFHTGCLRKWLYVQDTCPMCHQPVKPSATEGPQPIGGEQAEPEPVPEEGPPEDAAAEAAGRARTPGPSRAAEGGEPSWQQQENPALAAPSRAAEGGEPSWQQQENPALAEPSRAGLLPEAVCSREDEPMDPAGSRTPPPVSRGCTP